MVDAPYSSREPSVPHSHTNFESIRPPTEQAAPAKTVSFEHLLPDHHHSRVRLPLRISIFPHDTTDSIVATVRNFYGIYPSPTVTKGISFEDAEGRTLIARYENFTDQMTVFVRVFDQSPSPHGISQSPAYQQAVLNGDSHPGHAPHPFSEHIARATSRTAGRRSPSPGSQQRRSTSAGKPRSNASSTRGYSAYQDGLDNQGDALNGYTSGDGAPGSSSSKNRDHLGNTEGHRRKRAKFESSELPLFAPPLMPLAISNPSISPVRRAEQHRPSLPHVPQYGHPPQRPVQSPQSYNNGFGYSSLYATPTSEQQRSRHSIGYPPAVTPGAEILPTPDPTVGSCVSEEDKDVALQLMRLGGMSNISQGRTSTSTVDDTFSGYADAASSTGATSDSESDGDEELPAARRQRLDDLGNHQKILPTTESHFAPRESIETDEPIRRPLPTQGLMGAPKLKNPKPKTDAVNGTKPPTKVAKTTKPTTTTKPKVKKENGNGAAMTNGTVPMSPASMPTSRKQSVISSAAMPSASGDDEPDLSTKPRCQRCRKSKKGCDRQRPCGRCKDAGIPADQCISEDEHNGRKGRYGRHMGVPVKHAAAGTEMAAPPALLPAPAIATAADVAAAASNADKNKKRKR
ncbi:putative C6 finger domain protein [Coniochaeta sp. 2T2.1]|nr:putative C6 finger domain protein [Coniochaeta sp. 2T2.1]